MFDTGGGNLISISDLDAGGSSVEVTLTATNGTITLDDLIRNGVEFLVNTTTSNNQSNAQLAVDASGDFVVVWESQAQDNLDGKSGVYAQRFSSGVTFSVGDGLDDATMTFTGTVANINAALDGLTFDPTPEFSGAASLQIITDDQGNTGSGGPLTDDDTFAITVSSVNDAPTIISPNAASVSENQTAVLTVSATDIDLPADTITYSLTGGADLTAFSINAATGVLTFSTAPDFESPTDADTDNAYEVQVTADDGNGGTDVQAINATVTNVNESPVSSDVGYRTRNRSILNVAATGVLAGDSDEDGDPLTAVLLAGPAAGTLTISADGSFMYEPLPGFVGTIQFSYIANDGTASGNVATVTIVVNPGILPPAEKPAEDDRTEDETREDETTEDETTEDETVDALADPTILQQVSFSYEVSRMTSNRQSGPIRAAMSQVLGSIDDGLTFVLDTMVWQDLDELKKQVDNHNATTPVVAGTTAGVSSVVTAGYVLWTIRGGWLVSSLLAQMPAWQLVDPLLILDSLEDEELLDAEHHEEDKKVEEMFEEQVKAEPVRI